jgi:hypothetical protein
MSDAKNQSSHGPAGPAPSYADALIVASNSSIRAERREAEGMAPEQVRARHLTSLREYFRPYIVLWLMYLVTALSFAVVSGIYLQANAYVATAILAVMTVGLCILWVRDIVAAYKELYDSGLGMLVLGKDLLKYTDNVMSEDRSRILRVPEILAKDDEDRRRYAAAYLAMMDIQEMYHSDPDVRTTLAKFWLTRLSKFVASARRHESSDLQNTQLDDHDELPNPIDPKKAN